MTRKELVDKFKDPVIDRTLGEIQVELWFDQESCALNQYWFYLHDKRTTKDSTKLQTLIEIKREEVLNAWQHPIPFALTRAPIIEKVEEEPKELTVA